MVPLLGAGQYDRDGDLLSWPTGQHCASFVHGGRELVFFASVQQDAKAVPIGNRGGKDL